MKKEQGLNKPCSKISGKISADRAAAVRINARTAKDCFIR